MFVEIGPTLNFSLAMEVDEIEAGLLEKFSSLQTVDQPGESEFCTILLGYRKATKCGRSDFLQMTLAYHSLACL
jgi:hypothetical protein